MIVASDRRRQLRVRASLGVVDGRSGVNTVTRDVSTDGMFVRGLPYGIGDRIAVDVKFPQFAVPLHVAGDVVRVEKDLGVALRLLHPSEPQRLHFSGAIARLAWAKTEPGA
ncbi:MAG: PilZ domain-containing protein [Archangiaceae bacterium]|nr:PilZ domain-containing protein [Archangiaceae bacterium]